MSLRSACLFINVAIGLVGTMILLAARQVLGISGLPWTNFLYIGGGLSVCFVVANFLFLTFWILPGLSYLRRLGEVASTSPSPESPSRLCREFHELEALLHANTQYLQELAHNSKELLAHGGQPMIVPRSEHDVIGNSVQELWTAISSLEELINVIKQGNLLARFPESVSKTSLGKSFWSLNFGIRESLNRVRKEINNISQVSAKVAAMSQQGSRNAEIETQAVESMASSSHQVAQHLREVVEKLQTQTDSLDHTFSAIEEMIDSIEHTNQGIEALSTASKDTLQSIHEIHDFMQEIEAHAQSSSEISGNVTEQAKEGLNSVGEVIVGIQTIKTTVEEAATAIQRLGSESGRIGEILEVINDVAEQTNLLALNASIIAAQSGEHGRGFSVVAGEIKGLAERTRISTKEIAEIIGSVQNEVMQGMNAMQSCLTAVDKGVALANQSGDVLKHIVRGIQASRKMVATMARATATQTENSQQMKQATERMMEKLEELHSTVRSHAEGSAHLAEVTTYLKGITAQLDHSVAAQMQETDTIVDLIEEIRKLVHRNSRMAHNLAQSSMELGNLERNLAENIGKFFITPHQLPPHFSPQRPTIAFISQGDFLFFRKVFEGIQHTMASTSFQLLQLDCHGDPVLQTENINWLLSQHWLQGLIFTPVDEQTASHLVKQIVHQHRHVVAVDAPVEAATVSVTSDNIQGGEKAAALLHARLGNECVVLICGTRNISSINSRIQGFFKQARQYGWKVVEIFASATHPQHAREGVLEGIQLTPEADGIFLANEVATHAYIDLFAEHLLKECTLQAVGFDMTPKIADAIAEGCLLGSIMQDPLQLGGKAAQELLTLLEQPSDTPASSPGKVLIPVQAITRETLSENLFSS